MRHIIEGTTEEVTEELLRCFSGRHLQMTVEVIEAAADAALIDITGERRAVNYWITTHFPPEERNFDGAFYTGVWLQDGRQHVAGDMRPGDLVFKYESKTPRPTTHSNSGRGNSAAQNGRMGIVGIMRVTGNLIESAGSKPSEYIDGKQKWWRWHADADIHEEGFVPLVELNAILGYSPNCRLRGFGTSNSGLMKINKETFDRIYTAMNHSL